MIVFIRKADIIMRPKSGRGRWEGVKTHPAVWLSIWTLYTTRFKTHEFTLKFLVLFMAFSWGAPHEFHDVQTVFMGFSVKQFHGKYREKPGY